MGRKQRENRGARSAARARPRRLAAALVVLLPSVLLLGACGGDAPDEGPPGATPAPAAGDPVAQPPAVDEAPAEAAEGDGSVVAEQPPGSDEPVAAAEPPAPPAPPEQLPPVPATAPPPALSAPQSDALDAARALRAQGRQQDAIAALRRAEEQHGEHPLLRLEAGWCFQEIGEAAFREGGDKFFVKGNLADAKLRVDQARRMHEDLPGAVALLARNLLWSEDPDGAREMLTAHLETHPRDLLARLEAASLAETFKEWETADTHLTRAVELAPDRGDLVLRATIAKQWTQAYPAAKLRAGYLRAAKLLPDEHRPVDLLLKLYRTRSEQIEAADAVVADNPRATWARVWKAYLLRQPDADGNTDVAGAIEVLNEALAARPDDFELYFQRASAYLEAERKDEAFADFVRSVELGPEDNVVPASNALDQMLFMSPPTGHVTPQQRERAYAALVTKNPATGRYGNNAGLWYRDRGRDYEKSLKWYLTSVDAEPDEQDYLNDTALIWLFHLRDDKDKSLPMFEKVIRLVEVDGQEPKRGYWDALENLCKFHFEIGQYQNVIDYAARRANPDATVNGRPYPSMRAAQFAAQAKAALAKEQGE